MTSERKKYLEEKTKGKDINFFSSNRNINSYFYVVWEILANKNIIDSFINKSTK